MCMMLVVNSYVFYRMQNMCVHKHHSSSSSCTYAANIRKFWKPLFKAQPPLSEAEKLFLLNCQNATSLNPSKELVETFGPPAKRVRRPLRVLEGHKHADIDVKRDGVVLVISKVGAKRS